jgi:hypothetical protein
MVVPFSEALVRSNPCMLGKIQGSRMVLIEFVLVEFAVLNSFVIV